MCWQVIVKMSLAAAGWSLGCFLVFSRLLLIGWYYYGVARVLLVGVVRVLAIWGDCYLVDKMLVKCYWVVARYLARLFGVVSSKMVG